MQSKHNLAKTLEVKLLVIFIVLLIIFQLYVCEINSQF